MPIWLVLATLSGNADLGCVLQEGAEWNTEPQAVSAVVCDGRSGFFVPSVEYRSLLKVQEAPAYKLLDQELRLANEEIKALRSAAALSDSIVDQYKAMAVDYRISWRAAEADVQDLAKAVEEAAHRSWLESPVLWFAIGVISAAVVVYLAKKSDVTVVQSP